MFVALYEAVAKSGKESEFEEFWAEVTEAIFRVHGSLGSRLHTTETPGTYIAYAQWPTREIFEDQSKDGNYTPKEKTAFEKMRAATVSFRLLHRLEVRKDLLK
ncbi:MAG: antibiotic biosynthesis monooxygenase family protein [Bdellovibrionota bacterium]